MTKRRHTANEAALRAVIFGVTVLVVLGSLRESRADEDGDHMRTSIPGLEELKQLPPDGGPDFNRLVFEKSPYLLQHAGNPVDWYP